MLGDSPSREMDKVELSAGTGCGLADAWGYLAASRDRMRNRFSTEMDLVLQNRGFTHQQKAA